MTGSETPGSLARLDDLLRKQCASDRTATETIDRLLDIRLELMRKHEAG